MADRLPAGVFGVGGVRGDRLSAGIRLPLMDD
jgi:hypothetical protein